MIAVLFAEKDGAYSGRVSVDLWHIERDARGYGGPWPVVAHPPCQLWGTLAAVNYKRWGGEHNRPGNDGGCFESALRSVNAYFGVLEHPAKSRAWAEYGLVKPVRGAWCKSGEGWVCEVWQNAYGHRARKATWLYVRSRYGQPPEMRWFYNSAEYQVGFYDQRGREKNKPTLSKKEANATPPEFRDRLLELASWAGGRSM